MITRNIDTYAKACNVRFEDMVQHLQSDPLAHQQFKNWRDERVSCEGCGGEGIIQAQEHFGNDTFCPECNGSRDSENPDKPQRYAARYRDLDLPDYD